MRRENKKRDRERESEEKREDERECLKETNTRIISRGFDAFDSQSNSSLREAIDRTKLLPIKQAETVRRERESAEQSRERTRERTERTE